MYFIADNIVTSFEDFHKPYTHHHTGIPLEPKAQFFNIVQKGGRGGVKGHLNNVQKLRFCYHQRPSCKKIKKMLIAW